jgi:hypothetical protein
MRILAIAISILVVLAAVSCTSTALRSEKPVSELQQRIRILEYFRTLPIGTTVGQIEKDLKPDERLKAYPPTQSDPLFRFSYRKGDFLIFFAADTEMSSLPDNWLQVDLDYSGFHYIGEYSAQTGEKLEMIKLHYGNEGSESGE